MASKNIVPVDLSFLEGVQGSHKKALEVFLDFLAQQRKSRENLEWPLSTQLRTYRFIESTNVKELIEEWRYARLKYPNWIVLSQEQRETLWRYTETFASDERVFKDMEAIDELNYIYELNWRLEKSLFPIYNNVAIHFQRIVEKYNPFLLELNETKEINYNDGQHAEIDWNDIRYKFLSIYLALMRFYREEEFRTEWQKIFETLSKLESYLSPEQIAQFHYEQVLMSVFLLDNVGSKEILNKWPVNTSIPYWEAKRASLLAEFGQIEEAMKILEDSLSTIRKRLNLSPIEDDYYWVSQEAYVMFLLKMISQNFRFSKKDYLTSTDREIYNERWNDLRQYNCDPWSEKKYFDITLQQQYTIPSSKKTAKDFEIGRATVTYNLGGGDKQAVTAYTFLRYIEEVAIPLSLSNVNIDTKTINGALERIMPYSPKWGLAIMNRYRDYKIIDVVFDREYLSNLDHMQIDVLIGNYLQKYNQLFSEQDVNAVSKAFINKIPTILSRLCVKCSNTKKKEIFKFYQKLCKSEIKLQGINKLLKNLIQTSTSEILVDVIPLLLDTPVLNQEWAVAQTTFLEPFDSLSSIVSCNNLTVPKKILNDLFKKAANNDGFRVRALKRLMFLYLNNLLSTTQEEKLFKIIWEVTDGDSGFPSNTGYYNFAFIKWPQPKDVNADSLYRNYIERNNFDVQALSNTNGISMGGGSDHYAEELWHGSFSINNLEGVEWSQVDLEKILSKCESWWNADKHFLVDEQYKDEGFGGSVYNEFSQRFKNLVNIIARVFGHQKKILKDVIILNRITDLVIDMENHSMPILKAKAAFANILYENYQVYLNELQKAIVSKNHAMVIDGLESSILILYVNPFVKVKDFKIKLLYVILQPLKWRIDSLLGDCFDVLHNLIEYDEIDWKLVEATVLDTLQYQFSEGNLLYTSDNDLLLMKKKCLIMAGSIYRKQFKSTDSEISAIILEWKKIAEDPNEFGDIRKYWD